MLLVFVPRILLIQAILADEVDIAFRDVCYDAGNFLTVFQRVGDLIADVQRAGFRHSSHLRPVGFRLRSGGDIHDTSS